MIHLLQTPPTICHITLKKSVRPHLLYFSLFRRISTILLREDRVEIARFWAYCERLLILLWSHCKVNDTKARKTAITFNIKSRYYPLFKTVGVQLRSSAFLPQCDSKPLAVQPLYDGGLSAVIFRLFLSCYSTKRLLVWRKNIGKLNNNDENFTRTSTTTTTIVYGRHSIKFISYQKVGWRNNIFHWPPLLKKTYLAIFFYLKSDCVTAVVHLLPNIARRQKTIG